MARPGSRLASNAAGPFFVDSTCINCGTCWQFDPAHYAPTGSSSHVHNQPRGEAETRQALLALQACPVAAIKATPELVRHTPRDGFPALICEHPAGQVHYCGWASRRSFGASSYLVVRPAGNVLIDSPRYNAPLARQIEAMGGVACLLYTSDAADE